MKQYITMCKTQTGNYRVVEVMDYRFCAVRQLFKDQFVPGQLIEWLADDTRESETTEWINIEKERGKIVLYDLGKFFGKYDHYSCINEMLEKADYFEMSVKNFAEIIFQWDQLRQNRPEIMLVVIHEDNHVSLEVDPVVIKAYQDAGYAFKPDQKA